MEEIMERKKTQSRVSSFMVGFRINHQILLKRQNFTSQWNFEVKI